MAAKDNGAVSMADKAKGLAPDLLKEHNFDVEIPGMPEAGKLVASLLFCRGRNLRMKILRTTEGMKLMLALLQSVDLWCYVFPLDSQGKRLDNKISCCLSNPQILTLSFDYGAAPSGMFGGLFLQDPAHIELGFKVKIG